MKQQSPEYLEAEQVAQLLLSDTEQIAVIDVRDFDYLIGKVRGSLHFPFYQLESNLERLLRETSAYTLLIFHCRYSQRRAPTAAAMVLRALQEAGGPQRRIGILRGGWKVWQGLYQNNPKLYESLS